MKCIWLSFDFSCTNCMSGWPMNWWWQGYFFLIIHFNWRLITLQYCSVFCQTSTWVSHGCTCKVFYIYILADSWGNLLFSHSVVSDSLPPHGLQHTKLPCPSLSPRVCSKSFPLSWWCHPTVSSSEGIIELDYHHFTMPVELIDTGNDCQ